MSNIKQFLHPVRTKEITDSEPQTDLDLFINSGFTQADALNTVPNMKLSHLSEEDRQAMHESMKSDSQRTIEYFGPKFQEQQISLNRQIEAIEHIAVSAENQAKNSLQIAESSKILSDISTKKANKADVKSWLAIAISLIALCIEIILNRSELAIFFQSFI